MLTEEGKINWVETLAQIASDKGNTFLADHIRGFKPMPIVTAQPDYSGLSDHFAKPFNITKMPEATCDGCQ